MSYHRIVRVIEDFDGKFWADERWEYRGFWPGMYRPHAREPMGPYETKERANEALFYLRDGPKVHEEIDAEVLG